LNIGCGQVRFEGWVNADIDVSSPAVDIVWNACDRFPIEDGSCSLIYNEHFLEHLPVQQGVAFLGECHRLLQPGGVLRIAMPSLEEAIRHYVDNDWERQPWLAQYDCSWIATRAQCINIVFREWGHQWLYDREELHRRMREAGFATIDDCQIGQSSVPQLANRETRSESILICEGKKE
jgi:predicted SAM-dependent methyltransferase